MFTLLGFTELKQHLFGGGTHDIPTPFEKASRRFELRQGLGIIRIRPLKSEVNGEVKSEESHGKQIFLVLNPIQNHWLGPSTGKEEVLYPNLGNLQKWVSRDGQRKLGQARAYGEIRKLSGDFINSNWLEMNHWS
jgi:hypothetical protein